MQRSIVLDAARESSAMQPLADPGARQLRHSASAIATSSITAPSTR